MIMIMIQERVDLHLSLRQGKMHNRCEGEEQGATTHAYLGSPSAESVDAGSSVFQRPRELFIQCCSRMYICGGEVYY